MLDFCAVLASPFGNARAAAAVCRRRMSRMGSSPPPRLAVIAARALEFARLLAHRAVELLSAVEKMAAAVVDAAT